MQLGKVIKQWYTTHPGPFFAALLTAGFILITAIAILISPKAEAPAEVTPAAVKEEVKDEIPVGLALDALAREEPAATLVCHAPAVQGYLVHFKEAVTDSEKEQMKDQIQGWHYIEYMTMFKAGNGTYFIKEIPATSYVKVYPDVKNLDCKENK